MAELQRTAAQFLATAANPDDITALIDNGVLNSSPGTGGTLTLGGGVEINASPIVGGDISLQGNGDDLTLGTINFTTTTDLSVLRNIIVTGAVSTSNDSSLSINSQILTAPVLAVLWLLEPVLWTAVLH